MAQPPPRIISGELPSIEVHFIFSCSNPQARILFGTFFGVEGVESSPRSSCMYHMYVLRSFVTYVGPLLVSSQPGITGKYLKQECGAAARLVRAGIPHPFKCAAAAVQLLSHPLLSHAQTHPVGVRTYMLCRTPFF